MKILSNKTMNVLITALECTLTVASVALAVRDTYKAVDILIELKQETDDMPVATGIIVTKTAVCYIPTVAVTSIALVTNIVMGVRNNRMQSMLAATVAIAATQYESYREHTIELMGADKDDEIINEIADEKTYELMNADDTLFFDLYSGRFFFSNYEKVIYAMNQINKILLTRSECSLQELYDILGLGPNRISPYIGWESYAGETMYGYRWIDFELSKKKTKNNGEYVVIYFPFAPHALDDKCEKQLVAMGYDLEVIGRSGYGD